MTAIAAPAPKATSREWIGLAVLALPCLLALRDTGSPEAEPRPEVELDVAPAS